MSINEQKEEEIFSSSHSQFVDHSFGNVQTQNLEVIGNLYLSNILNGSPSDGGTISIPSRSCVVIIQNTVAYTQLTINMPLEPNYGQILIIVSTVDIDNLILDGSFGTAKPINLKEDIPRRFIFAGLWYNI